VTEVAVEKKDDKLETISTSRIKPSRFVYPMTKRVSLQSASPSTSPTPTAPTVLMRRNLSRQEQEEISEPPEFRMLASLLFCGGSLLCYYPIFRLFLFFVYFLQFLLNFVQINYRQSIIHFMFFSSFTQTLINTPTYL